MEHKLLHPSRIFSLFKYAVYFALLCNVWFFFEEDWAAAAYLLDAASGMQRFVEVFAQTIDTAAWVVLLLLFELETSYLSDYSLQRRRVRWSLHGVRALCALIILNSLLGYTGKYLNYLDVQAYAVDACTLVDAGWSVLEAFDEFVALSADNCSALSAGQLLLMNGEQILVPGSLIEQVQELALVDVINASAWILVVILLEIDVRLQLRGAFSGAILRISSALKLVVYAVLLGAAVYWGFIGDFLDFWDAFLWLVAFVFIEMNLFQWQEQSDQLAHDPTGAA